MDLYSSSIMSEAVTKLGICKTYFETADIISILPDNEETRASFYRMQKLDYLDKIAMRAYVKNKLVKELLNVHMSKASEKPLLNSDS